jgi:hypothetical protein
MKPRLKTAALLSLGSSLALCCLASSAAASKTFPEALRQQLGLPKIAGPGMGCQLCHRDDNGGVMTATKPFGRTLVQTGVQGGNVPSLRSALTELEASGKDSDEDGAGDIAELKADTDPNTASGAGGGAGDSPGASESEDIPLPETGCSLASARTRGGAGILFGLALALLWRRRR